MMRSTKSLLVPPLVALALIAALVLSGCGPTPIPISEMSEPFSSRSVSEDGIVVGWNGYSKGYQPRQDYMADLDFENGSNETWHGRYCVCLLDDQNVVATLGQQDFTLDPGAAMGTPHTISFPDDLAEGAYALALVVHQPHGPIVNSVTIQVGDTTGVHRSQESATQAALAACPPVMQVGAGSLVNLATADLQERLTVSSDEIAVRSVEATEFPNASLGVLEPGKMYAEAITPGYVIRLAVNGAAYEYHGSGDRVVFAPTSFPTPAPVYQEVSIPEAGLVFEVPAGWLRLEPEWVWAADDANSRRIGVNWMEVRPPQEVEAAMLPTPSQVIRSETVELGWTSGRSFTVEVYAPVAQGDDTRAPVQSVETHVLIVVSLGETRRAFDFYASGQTAEQLALLEPSLQHMLETSAKGSTWFLISDVEQ